jgi:exonuclease SbcC
MRKGHCFGRVDFDVNGNLYRVERQSVRHQTRKGKQHAVTHLNLSRLNSAGEEIQDLNGEQRRETEKALRDLVGTSDDFLMTSLASQGEMNSFIKNKGTQRKTILGKFLDLNVFDRMLDIAKKESATTKALLKRVPNKEWDIVIGEKEQLVDSRIKERDNLTKELDDKRCSLQQLQITLATHKDKDVIAEDDILRQKNKIAKLKNDEAEYRNQSAFLDALLDDINLKLEKIHKIKDQFPINELNEQFNVQINLERNLIDVEYSYEKELALLKTQKKSVSILNEVPCGDKFPTCKFIKNSHKNKQLLLLQEEKTKEILSNVRASRKMLKKLKQENIKDKIQRYNEVLLQESDLCIEKSKHQIQFNELEIQLNNCKKLIDDSEKELISMKLCVSSSKAAIEVSKLRKTISDLNANINHVDTQRLLGSETIVLLQSEIENLKCEKNEWKHLLDEWKSYEILLNAVSKKGIPLQIMNSQLPLINVEISKILQGVVGFTVELLADPDTSDMDIFINYGDSRRIIECASGMEKMMASLAIRVALINISCLPKTDILIIDEGFGALDEMNVEACNRLLGSLKKWFKNILVISHVDAVKDAVDNVLEITSKGKDAGVHYV